jgi:hypothetical protein
MLAARDAVGQLAEAREVVDLEQGVAVGARQALAGIDLRFDQVENSICSVCRFRRAGSRTALLEDWKPSYSAPARERKAGTPSAGPPEGALAH